MVDTEVVAGLAVGYFGGQFLGNLIESKIKPDILDTSTSNDKMIAGVANDGTKLVFAYGAYKTGPTSPFLKNVTWGSVLAAVIDAGWRYSHNGVPYGYKPFNIPLLGDLNEIIAGPNTESENIRTMDACSDARAAADRACSRVPTPVPAPTKVPSDIADYVPPDSVTKFHEQQKAIIENQNKCYAIKADATSKKRAYTKAEKDMCGSLLCKTVVDGRCVPPLYGLDISDSVEDILMKGQELLALPAPPMSPAKKQAICSSIKIDAIAKNRPYTAQEMEMCTGLLSKYTTSESDTSPGDITPPEDITAPSQDEYTPSTIPDRKSRFAFMEEKVARHFGFTLGSPTSGREKYFGMKT
jgi:hypothetical protein